MTPQTHLKPDTISPPVKKRHVLLVDDEESLRRSISHNLRKKGYEVTVAENAESAIEKLGETSFDVIITDLQMTGADGIQVLKKARELRPNAKVIILTGFASLATALDAVKYGAFDYMLKPCNSEELFLRVERCMECIELQEQVKRHITELEDANEKLRQLSSLDGLTGIFNRRTFDEYLEREWSLAMRNNIEISLIFIDVDYFKVFNDSYGHQAGDECLQQVASTIKESLKRPTDLAARYGGEEFVALLVGTNKENTVKIAEEMRRKVESLAVPHKHSVVCNHVTISLGVATVTPNRKLKPSDFVKQADVALYSAKQNGRNQVKT